MVINAWATKAPNQPLEPYTYDPGPLAANDVEIAVENCGLCHSDVSVMNNEWGISSYPVIRGHEVIGRVVSLGDNAKRLSIGQRVGIGWGSSSCMHCEQCLGGEGNLCAQNVPTIVGHRGGFADRVRAQWPWALLQACSHSIRAQLDCDTGRLSVSQSPLAGMSMTDCPLGAARGFDARSRACE